MDAYVAQKNNIEAETNLVVAQGVLYMAAKINENIDMRYNFGFAEFLIESFMATQSVVEELLSLWGLQLEDFFWNEDMYPMLERSVATTLGFKMNLITPVEVIQTMVATLSSHGMQLDVQHVVARATSLSYLCLSGKQHSLLTLVDN